MVTRTYRNLKLQIAESRYPSVLDVYINPWLLNRGVNKQENEERWGSIFIREEKVNFLRQREILKWVVFRTSSKQVAGLSLVYILVAKGWDTPTLDDTKRESRSLVLDDSGGLTSTRKLLLVDIHFSEEMVFIYGSWIFSYLQLNTPYRIQGTKLWTGLFQSQLTGLSSILWTSYTPFWKRSLSGSCMWSVSAQSSGSSPFPHVLHPVWIIMILNLFLMCGRTGDEQMCSSNK